jgi:hypothetical protein
MNDSASQVTSIFREADSRGCRRLRPQLSFFFFAKKFFRAISPQKIGGHRLPLQGDSNEVDWANILALWLSRVFEKHASFSPPSPSKNLRRLAHGKSYPVTAAQLLPNLAGIPRTGPLIKLAKNCRQK